MRSRPPDTPTSSRRAARRAGRGGGTLPGRPLPRRAPRGRRPPEAAAGRRRARNVGGAPDAAGWYRARKSLPGGAAVVADEAALLGERGWRVADVPVVDLTQGFARGKRPPSGGKVMRFAARE